MVQYLVFLAISTSIFALFALGLNLQWGFTGLINFGHVVFMTLGAYTTVLLSLKGVPLLVAAPIGAVVAALLGLIIGFTTLRLREDYLAIVTIGVGELIRLIVNNQDLPVGDTWISGAFGIQSYPIPLANLQPNLFLKLVTIGLLTVLAGITFYWLWRWIRPTRALAGVDSPKRVGKKPEFILRLVIGALLGLLSAAIYISGVIALYDYDPKAGLMLLSLLLLAFVFWRLEVLVRSPWGRVLKAIREDEEVPKALGKNVFWYKLQSFMLGGAIAGIAGALFAWQLSAIYPDNFQPQLTFDAWIMVILGGSGNNIGTILGAVIYFAYDTLTREFLPRIFTNLSSDQLGAFRIMVIGLILMVLMIWRPQGILGKKEELTLGK
ncbi:MAG: branched-chain amino acid ABC transporter permease [Chlorogloeopsis fritschii C42_A2020_084]|uniref:branched-chain amino acid ABC transporter permease n=1 Tax=Chlorogloeopsis fritschii TaxID=1124 RepID=UPI0019ED221D|nr:branched-chain amino acid ABC transporter permease [Chlorogloeopsis fritschii]MBF2005914.1 branched-chain amino acid ABC transporter permease [Chlorogloeopsis fritschii C42_A2020_084]